MLPTPPQPQQQSAQRQSGTLRPLKAAIQQQRRPLSLHRERSEVDVLLRRVRPPAQRAESIEPVDQRRDEGDVARATASGVERRDGAVTECLARGIVDRE